MKLVRFSGIGTLARAAVLVTFAMLGANQSFAQVNQPPPAGPLVLDLDGTAIPHAYQIYNTSFTATSAQSFISFAFREDPAFLELSNVSVTTGGGLNLLTNGDFSLGPTDSSTPTGWTYLNTFGAAFGGVVQAGCGSGGGNCYVDGAVQAYDAITQQIATTPGQVYDISFYLNDTGNLGTFSALSTNGDTTDTGGNGVDLLVYAGASQPTADPAPGPIPIPGAGLLSYLAIGLLGLGSFGWKRLRQASTH
jgi:hypothetical protein